MESLSHMESLSPGVMRGKKILLDPYASIALADVHENQKSIQNELNKVHRCAGATWS